MPKNLHCGNIDKVVLPTKLKIKLRNSNKTKPIHDTIQVSSVTVPDRQHTQYPSLLLAATVLQRLASSSEEG